MSITQLRSKSPDKSLPSGWSIKPVADKAGTFFKVFQQGRYRLSFPSYDGAVGFIKQSTARRHSCRQERAV